MFREINHKMYAKLHDGDGKISIWEIPVGCSEEYEEIVKRGTLKSTRIKGVFRLARGGAKDPDQQLYNEMTPIEKDAEPTGSGYEERQGKILFHGMEVHYPRAGERRSSPYVLKKVACGRCDAPIELKASVSCDRDRKPTRLQTFHPTDCLSKKQQLKPEHPASWLCPVCLGILPKQAAPPPDAPPSEPPAEAPLMFKGHQIHRDSVSAYALKTVNCYECQREIELRASVCVRDGKPTTMQSFRAIDGKAKTVHVAGPNTRWNCAACLEKGKAPEEEPELQPQPPELAPPTPEPPPVTPEPPPVTPEPPPVTPEPPRPPGSAVSLGEKVLLDEVMRICEDGNSYSDQFCLGVAKMIYARYGGVS